LIGQQKAVVSLHFSGVSFRRIASTVLRPTAIPAAIALIVVIAAGIFAEYQNRRVFEQDSRTRVLNQVSLIRARLEGNINGNIQLVRGLIATLTTEPDMDQARFAELAANLFREKSQLRNVAGAPEFIVSMMYPMEGNEKAIGLNYRTNERQRETALQAFRSNTLVLAGPVDLVQGGQGFVARFPVYHERSGVPEFWGIVSAVVDVESLYRDSGLRDPNLPIEIALTGKDALGRKGEHFFGSEAITTDDPVKADVLFPSGSWQIAARPKGGWQTAPDDLWTLRLIIALAGALVVVPIMVTGWLIGERQQHIRDLRKGEAALKQLSRRLGLALDSSKVGVWEFDLQTRELFWDERMSELVGLPPHDGPRDASQWDATVHPEDRAHANADFQRALEARCDYTSAFRVVLPDGAIRHIRSSGRFYEEAGAAKFIGVDWDVTADVALNEDLKRAKTLAEARNAELEAAKARIEHNALHDALTGLPNRRYLDDILAMHAAQCHRNGATAGLLHIDLDRFKQINDTLGHAAGDAMLVHASQVLQSSIRGGDFVARIGGDEFVVLCMSNGEAEYLAGLAMRIIEEMRQPVAYEGHECRFGVSVGIASAAGTAVDPKRLLVNADIALYRAKSRGRNRHEFFTEALQAEIVSTKRIADDILSGLERNEFVAWYQPQFDAASLAVIGVEALARWSHPKKGLLAPDFFLKTAEELNVVATIDRMILEQTLANFHSWTAAGLAIPKVSVNVSARRLQDEELIHSLRQLYIQPRTVSFELVESIFLDEDDALVAWNIEQIKELGIDIEIDDFGTGYASIVSLLKLQPRRLKIDRQLVMPIVDAPARRPLVESIVQIGKSLGIEVLAEGVETMQHARILREIGCDALQGYAFAPAMSAADLADFVRGQRWRKAS
jgi:diguanylate cyclase (GGDEF)-like protein/PAS domain S-box-containing protein